jgi:hypothetical protein
MQLIGRLLSLVLCFFGLVPATVAALLLFNQLEE